MLSAILEQDSTEHGERQDGAWGVRGVDVSPARMRCVEIRKHSAAQTGSFIGNAYDFAVVHFKNTSFASSSNQLGSELVLRELETYLNQFFIPDPSDLDNAGSYRLPTTELSEASARKASKNLFDDGNYDKILAAPGFNGVSAAAKEEIAKHKVRYVSFKPRQILTVLQDTFVPLLNCVERSAFVSMRNTGGEGNVPVTQLSSGLTYQNVVSEWQWNLRPRFPAAKKRNDTTLQGFQQNRCGTWRLRVLFLIFIDVRAVDREST